MRAPKRFEGKVAIITGATAPLSIGRATAALLADEGASVVINGRSPDQLKEALAAMEAQGFQVAGIAGSAGEDDLPARLADLAKERFGRIDYVVNTVGGSAGAATPMQMDRDRLIGTIELNTWNALSMVQQAMRQGLADDGGGAVVNISSGTVHKTTPSMIAYAAAKSALNAMTRTLARDLAAQNVRVNGVAPGFTKTSGTKPMWEADDGATAGSQVPLRRMTEQIDIANAVAFFLSEEARAITGVTIDVDGGNHLSSGWSPITQQTSGS